MNPTHCDPIQQSRKSFWGNLDWMMNRCPWPNCPETFDEREEVKDHLSSSHLDYYPYRCGRCRVMFPSRIQVDYHWTAEHDDDGPASVACCVSRAKEQRLNALLSSESVVNDSQHAITVTAEPTSNAPIDLNHFFRRRRRANQASAVHVKENSAFDDSLAVGEFEVADQSPESGDFSDAMASAAAVSALSANSSPSELTASPLISNECQLPTEVIERIRDLTANRAQLIDAPVEQRLKYFASQLAIAIPNVPLADIQSSFTCPQKSTLAEILDAQQWPATAVLAATLQEFKAFLPSNEVELLPLVRNCIAHARKIVNQHICRDRENQSLNESGISSSTNKKPRLERRLAGD